MNATERDAQHTRDQRDYLFDMLASLALLAKRRGDIALAAILEALVAGYRSDERVED